MAVRKIKTTWWVDFRFNGERIRKRSPENSRAGATAYEHVLRQKLAIGETLKSTQDIQNERNRQQRFETFAWQWFNTYVKANNKHSEIENKKFILRNALIPFFGDVPIQEIDTRLVEEFKATKIGQGLANKSINNYLTVLRTCLTMAQDWLELDKVPRIKLLKTPKPDTNYLSEQEATRLLAHLEGDWRRIILTALRTGLRLGEIRGLGWSDIDWENRRITVRHSWCRYKQGLTSPKSNKIRYIPLTYDLYETLSRQKKAKGLVFSTHESGNFDPNKIRYILSRACESAGIKPVKFHELRHSFASQLVMKGAPLAAVQSLLGHSDIRTTMRYAHLAQSSLKDAVHLLEPKLSLDLGQQAVNLRTVPMTSDRRQIQRHAQ